MDLSRAAIRGCSMLSNIWATLITIVFQPTLPYISNVRYQNRLPNYKALRNLFPPTANINRRTLIDSGQTTFQECALDNGGEQPNASFPITPFSVHRRIEPFRLGG